METKISFVLLVILIASIIGFFVYTKFFYKQQNKKNTEAEAALRALAIGTVIKLDDSNTSSTGEYKVNSSHYRENEMLYLVNKCVTKRIIVELDERMCKVSDKKAKTLFLKPGEGVAIICTS